MHSLVSHVCFPFQSILYISAKAISLKFGFDYPFPLLNSIFRFFLAVVVSFWLFNWASMPCVIWHLPAPCSPCLTLPCSSLWPKHTEIFVSQLHYTNFHFFPYSRFFLLSRILWLLVSHLSNQFRCHLLMEGFSEIDVPSVFMISCFSFVTVKTGQHLQCPDDVSILLLCYNQPQPLATVCV